MCRYSGYLLMRLMYGVRTAEAMLATKLLDQIRMAELFARILSEHAGILCAAAIFSLGRVTGVPGQQQEHSLIKQPNRLTAAPSLGASA